MNCNKKDLFLLIINLWCEEYTCAFVRDASFFVSESTDSCIVFSNGNCI